MAMHSAIEPTQLFMFLSSAAQGLELYIVTSDRQVYRMVPPRSPPPKGNRCTSCLEDCETQLCILCLAQLAFDLSQATGQDQHAHCGWELIFL
eukprot:4825303-Amphidinium_carterae.1